MAKTSTAPPPVSVAVPGHHPPAVGVEAPFELLAACHERVVRTLQLLDRLRHYLRSHTVDAAARSAATDVLRYFDIAAPLHHEDEELHVFPPLLLRGDEATRTLVHQLQEDHRQMNFAWVQAREVLQSIVDSAPGQPMPWQEQQTHALEKFSSLYAQHINAEEKLIYPLARQQLTPLALATMQHDMRARRGVTAPNRM